MTPTPNQDDVLIALRDFLLLVLPDGVEVIAALINRVPEPEGDDFVVMTPIRYMRLATNFDAWADVKFTGSIAGAVMTVEEMAFGAILAGASVFGVDVLSGTLVVDQIDGTPGGAGTYTVSKTQTIATQTLASGGKTLEQKAEVTVQIDFHSKNFSAADMAQTVSTTLRDAYGVEQMAGTGVTPLYADDPKQMPFYNEAQQFEWRWVVESNFQINQIVAVPQQYADAVEVEVISVDATYPPA